MGELTAREVSPPIPTLVFLHTLPWPLLSSPKRLLLVKFVTSNISVNRMAGNRGKYTEGGCVTALRTSWRFMRLVSESEGVRLQG